MREANREARTYIHTHTIKNTPTVYVRERETGEGQEKEMLISHREICCCHIQDDI